VTTFVRILGSLRSSVQFRANARIAALIALYTLNAGVALIDTTEALRITDAPGGVSGSAFAP
jgi:hypothetical protein